MVEVVPAHKGESFLADDTTDDAVFHSSPLLLTDTNVLMFCLCNWVMFTFHRPSHLVTLGRRPQQ